MRRPGRGLAWCVALLCLGGSSACVGAVRPPLSAPEPRHEAPPALPPMDLEARPGAEIGAGLPVAILPWHRGLVAASADGQRQRVLVPGPIAFALVDNRARVVWFGKESATPGGDELWLLDLAARADTAPALVATGLPGGCDFSVEYPDSAAPSGREALVLGWRVDVPEVQIAFGEAGGQAPTLTVRAPYHGDVDEMEVESAELTRDARLAADAEPLLRALGQRGAGRRASLPVPSGGDPDEGRVPTVEDEQCHNEGVCGTMRRVLGTRLMFVIVSQWCPGGEGCVLGLQLFDPDRQLFLSLHRPGVVAPAPIEELNIGMEVVWVSADGRALVHEGAIVVPGVSRVDEPRDDNAVSAPRGGGWLGGQWMAGALSL